MSGNLPILSRKGYTIEKKDYDKKFIENIKKELTITPISLSDIGGNSPPVKNYIETDKILNIPRYYGDNKFQNKEVRRSKSEKINVNFNGVLREVQNEPYEKLYNHIKNNNTGIFSLATGQGKCLGKGTNVLMYDGTLKVVEDIVEGDKLMGDDSKLRNVLSIARGTEEMYKITNSHGDVYRVNKNHILVLKNIVENPLITKNEKGKYITEWWENDEKNTIITENIVNLKNQKYSEITVENYLKKSQCFKNCFIEYKKEVYFPHIKDDISDFYNFGYELNNKIPYKYKCNSIENRKLLLAGIIDKMAYIFLDSFFINNNGFEEDIIFLARSLGLDCLIERKGIRICGKVLKSIPNRYISENSRNVPCTFKIEFDKVDDYYGFVIDCNNRFLLGNFSVTHNTVLSLKLVSDIKLRTLIISAGVNQVDLLNQWSESIKKFMPNTTVGRLQGKIIDYENKDIIIATVSSLSSKEYGSEVFKGIGMVIIDECYHISSPTFSKCLFKIGGIKHVLGVSATPERPDGLTKVFKQWVGDIFYESKTIRKGLTTKVLMVRLRNSVHYKEHFITCYGKENICFVKMISDLIEIHNRNKLIIDLVEYYSKEKRTILVITDRVKHVKELGRLLKLKGIEFGLYIGTEMKDKEKKESIAKSIIIATTKSFGEGIDKSDLDTLVIASPKKHSETNQTKIGSSNFIQLVGRIFRKNHKDINPLIIDIWDMFSVFQNQGYSRQKYYNKHLSAEIKKIDIEIDEYKKFSDRLLKNTNNIEEIEELVIEECFL